jgi:hypothetical protein
MARSRNIMIGLGVAFGIFASIYLVVMRPDIPAALALIGLGGNIILYGFLGLLLWLVWRGLRWMYRRVRRSYTIKRTLTLLGGITSAVGGLVLLFRWLEYMQFWLGPSGILLGFFLMPGELLLPFIWWAKHGYVPQAVFWPWLVTVAGAILLTLGRKIQRPEDLSQSELPPQAQDVFIRSELPPESRDILGQPDAQSISSTQGIGGCRSKALLVGVVVVVLSFIGLSYYSSLVFVVRPTVMPAVANTPTKEAMAPSIVSLSPTPRLWPTLTPRPWPTFSPRPSPSPTPRPPSARVLAQPCLRLREGPGLDFRELDCLRPATSVSLLGRAVAQQAWVMVITSGGAYGWMKADRGLLDYNVALESLPAAFYRPYTSMIQVLVQLSGEGELRITNAGHRDAVVVLANGHHTIIAVYVRGGEKITVDGVPDGTYGVFFIAGADWDGSTFHSVAERQKFVDPLYFTTTTQNSTIWTITIQTILGNTSGEDVTAEEFPSILSDIAGG